MAAGKSSARLRAVLLERNTTHGQSGTPAYTTWRGMMDRCTNPNNSRWHQYGGAGITVCERWRDFANFFADMGPRPPGTSLDRIDNGKGYEPGNCRWATAKEQHRNRKITRLYEYQGEMLTLQEISDRTGIEYTTLRNRIIYRGMPLDIATAHQDIRRRESRHVSRHKQRPTQ